MPGRRVMVKYKKTTAQAAIRKDGFATGAVDPRQVASCDNLCASLTFLIVFCVMLIVKGYYCG